MSCQVVLSGSELALCLSHLTISHNSITTSLSMGVMSSIPAPPGSVQSLLEELLLIRRIPFRLDTEAAPKQLQGKQPV